MKADRPMIVDGVEYNKGDEIWDLGSFVAVEARGMMRSYEGLSKDAPGKLPHYVSSGSSAFCLDTGDMYKFHKQTDKWYLQIQSGGATPEQIQQAVDNYLEENPVSGMTEEQVKQLNRVTEDILKKVDISQGAENSGKILTVGLDGIVTPVEMDETLTDNTKAAPAGVVGKLKDDLSQVRTLTIKETAVKHEEPIKNKLEWTNGYYMSTNGNTGVNSLYSYSSMINVKAGDILSVDAPPTFGGFRFVTAYVNGSAVAEKGSTSNIKTYTVPEDVTGVILTTETIHVNHKSWDVKFTHEETIASNILDDDIKELKNDVEGLQGKIETPIHVYLPKEICVGVGRTIELYNDLVCLEAEKYHINWLCSVGIAYKRKFSVTGTASNVGTYMLTLRIYDDGMNLVTSKTATIKIAENNIASTLHVVPIGDSLTNQKAWEPEVQTLSDGKIVYIGTRKGAYDAYKHEGRSGVQAHWYNADSTYTFDSNYVGNIEVDGESNPFWDGSKFSLAHYIDTQSSTIGEPDAVQILLGTNGMATDPTANVTGIMAIVDSIRAEYSDMPIFVCNTIYRSNQDGYYSTGVDGYAPVSDFQFSADVKVMNLQNALADALDGYTNVYIVPLSVCMDRDNNFGQIDTPVNPRLTDVRTHIAKESVHPQNAGYMQMADVMYSSYIVHLS